MNRMKGTKHQYDDRIIEARWDLDQRAWRLKRIRDDKFDANHISVVESIIETIINPVRQEDVCTPLFLPRSQHRASSVAYQQTEF